MIQLTFGERITDLREKRGLSQGDIAKVVGVRRNTISSYESDRIKPSYDKVVKLAEFFGVSYDELFGQPLPKMEGPVYTTYKGRAVSTQSVVRLLQAIAPEDRPGVLAALVAIRGNAKVRVADLLRAFLSKE